MYVSKLDFSRFKIICCIETDVIHKENPTRCDSASKFYFLFTRSSTCFGWHTAHHQEP